MSDASRRIKRLLSLIPYVIKHQGCTVQELCAVFHVSRKQLLGDLDTIFCCGQPEYTPADLIDVELDGERVYIRMADYFSRPLMFTSSELVGMYLACKAAEKMVGRSASLTLRSALAKMERALGFPVSVEGNEVEESVEVPDLQRERGAVDDLSTAARERKVVEMEYYVHGRDEMTRRRVYPLSLVFGMGHWYMRAWDEGRGEARTFRLDRIRSYRVTDETFQLPPGKWSEEGLPLPKFGDGSLQVLLRFSPRLAKWAREQPIFQDREEDGNGLLCTLRSDSLSWLEREVLKYGLEVEVLGPDEVRESLASRIRRMLQIYRRPETPSLGGQETPEGKAAGSPKGKKRG